MSEQSLADLIDDNPGLRFLREVGEAIGQLAKERDEARSERDEARAELVATRQATAEEIASVIDLYQDRATRDLDFPHSAETDARLEGKLLAYETAASIARSIGKKPKPEATL